MKVCITGAAGFIGSYLAENLLQKNYSVIGIDNFDSFYQSDWKKNNLEILEKYPKFRFIKDDVRHYKTINSIFSKEKFSHVFHLAGRGGIKPSVTKPFFYLDNILKGTLSVLEACQKNKVEVFINASSSSVYGRLTQYPYNEGLLTDYPTAPYAAFKKATELLTYTYHHLYHISVYNFRFFSVYGPRGRPDQIIFKFTDQIINKKPIVWFEPEPIRDFTYVSDIVDGLTTTLALKEKTYKTLNLAFGKPYSLRQAIRYIEQYVGVKAIISSKIQSPPVFDFPKTYADITQAKKILHWQPKISLEKGIQLFVDWYKKSQRTL